MDNKDRNEWQSEKTWVNVLNPYYVETRVGVSLGNHVQETIALWYDSNMATRNRSGRFIDPVRIQNEWTYLTQSYS